MPKAIQFYLNKKNMIDDTKNILNTFQEYAKTFERLKPSVVLPFYHYPAILISLEKAVAIKNRIEGFIVFIIIMSDLKRRGYAKSVTESLSVKQLSDNLAVVSGVVVRLKKDALELERFGLNYTMYKVDNSWKIVAGALYRVDE